MLTAQPEDTDRVRCPHCKTTKLRILNKIDRIETIYGNRFMNRIRARRGDTIYHCVYCRLQFYDPRKPGSATRERGSSHHPQQPSFSHASTRAERAAVPEIAPAPLAAPAPAPAPLR